MTIKAPYIELRNSVRIGDKNMLFEALAQAYMTLYATVKERKMKEIIKEIQNGGNYGKYTGIQNA